MRHNAESKSSLMTGAGVFSLMPYLVIAAAFSVVSNFLLLIPPLHMLQVYDRVLVSGSIETLFLITGIATFLLGIYGFSEFGRRRALGLGAEKLRSDLGALLLRSALEGADAQRQVRQDLVDIRTVHGFLSGGQSLAVMDVFFTPAFLGALFIVHPLLGMLGLFSAVVLILAAIISEWHSRKVVDRSEVADHEAQTFVLDVVRSHKALNALGMVSVVQDLFQTRQKNASDLAMMSAGSSNLFGSAARSFRNVIQVVALSLGALLVLQQETSAGAIVAGSILIGKALAPIDQCIGGWRFLVRARRSTAALSKRLNEVDRLPLNHTPLPRPEGRLEIIAAEISPGSEVEALFPKFNLRLEPGAVVGVVGKSGVGKSTLLKAFSGSLPMSSGSILLGGRDIHAWPSDDRGQYIGYAPPSADLMPITVMDNISRGRNADPDEVYDLTSALGVHETILSLPRGYDTIAVSLGDGFSSGQRQSICLARAFFRNPVLVLLDEPSAHLDGAQLIGLKRKIKEVANSGSIVVIAFQDGRLVECCSHILTLSRAEIDFTDLKTYLQRSRPRGQSVPGLQVTNK